MKGHILKIINARYGQVSFLKFSTPNSGQGPYSKVIFLVFKNNKDRPFLCVKTVRQAADNDTIKCGFNKLKALHDLVKGSDFEEMFPKPILIDEDDNGIAFSLETACQGSKPKRKQLQQILDVYKNQQDFLFEQQPAYIEDFDQYVKDIIQKLELHPDEVNKLWEHYQNKIKNQDNFKILRIPQHGDLTLDNIFINQKGVHIFDCERFGDIDIAGFDIFHLLYRVSKYDSSNKQLLFVYFLHEFLIKKETLQGKLNAEFIIKSVDDEVITLH